MEGGRYRQDVPLSIVTLRGRRGRRGGGGGWEGRIEGGLT